MQLCEKPKWASETYLLGAELDMEGNHCLISLQTYAEKKKQREKLLSGLKKKKRRIKG